MDVDDITSNLQNAISDISNEVFSEITRGRQEFLNSFESGGATNITTLSTDDVAKLQSKLSSADSAFSSILNTNEQVNQRLTTTNTHLEFVNSLTSEQSDLNDDILRNRNYLIGAGDTIVENQQTINELNNQLNNEIEGSSVYEDLIQKIQAEGDKLIANQTIYDAIEDKIKLQTDLHDNVLGKMLEIAQTNTDENELKEMANELLLRRSDILKDQLQTIQEQESKIPAIGADRTKLISEYSRVTNEFVNSLESFTDRIDGFLGNIPLVGKMLSKTFSGTLSKATEEITQKFSDMTKSMVQAAADGKSFTTIIGMGLAGVGGAIVSIGKGILKLILNPFFLVLAAVGSFIALLKLAYNEFTRIEDATKEFREQFGFLASDVQNFRKISVKVETDFQDFGIRVEDANKAASSLTEEFASASYVQEEQIRFATLLEKATGLTSENTAKAMNSLMKLGKTSSAVAIKTITKIQSTTRAYGISFSRVMEDIASASESALIFSRGSAKALANGAVQARRLGSSLEDAASSADSLLNFEESIRSEMELGSMFGRRINLNAMRRAALEGDTAKLLEERLKIMEDLGGLESMSPWQQRQLAESMGTSLDVLYEMQKTKKQEIALQNLANRGYQPAIEALHKIKKAKEDEARTSEMSLEQQMKMQLQENQQLEAANAIQEKISSQFLNIKKLLMPIVASILPKILGFLNGIFDETGGLTKEGEGLKNTFSSIGTAIMNVGDTILSVGKFFSKFFGENAIQNLIVIVGLFFGLKTALGLIGGLAGKLTSKLLGGSGGAGGGNVLGMNPVAMLAAATSVAILAGALYVGAKGFQEFANVEWPEIGKGAVVLGILTGAALSLGLLMKSGVGAAALLLGAVAIAALGASLIPLAYALKLATPALEAFGDIIKSVFVGLASVITAIGTVIVGVVTAIGNAISGIIDSVSGAISSMVQDISTLGEVDPLQLLAVAGAIGAVGLAMASFGVAGGIGAAASGAGNALGAMGNAVAGLFGANTEELNKSPVEQLINLITRLSAIDVNLDNFDAINNFNISEFLGGLSNIPKNAGKSLELLGDGLSKFAKGFDTLKSNNINKIPTFAESFVKLKSSLSSSSIPSNIENDLENLGDGIGDLVNGLTDIDNLSANTLKILPEFASGIKQLAIGFGDFYIGKDVETYASRLDDALSQFGQINSDTIPNLKQLLPMAGSIATAIDVFTKIKPGNNGEQLENYFDQLGNALNKLGSGIMQTKFLGLNDTEATNAVTSQIQSLGKILTPISDFKNLLEKVSSSNITIESALLNLIGNAEQVVIDPMLNKLNAMNQAIYQLCTNVDKLNSTKINELKGSVLQGAKGPVGNQGITGPSSLPAADPFGTTVIEGAIEPKLMMSETANLPVIDVVDGVKQFQYGGVVNSPTLGMIGEGAIEPKLMMSETANLPVIDVVDGVKQFQNGGVVNSPTLGMIGEGGESEYIIPASKMDSAMSRYSAGVRGGSVIRGGSLVTKQKPEISILKNEKVNDAKKVNEMVQPIVDVVGSIYTKFIPESIKQKFSDFAKNEYFNLDEDHSMETYKRSLGVNESVTNNILGDMGVMSAKDASTLKSSGGDVTKNEFTSSTQYERVAQSTGLLDQIMAGVLRKELPTKLYAEGQLVGLNTDANKRMYTDEGGFTQVEESMKTSVKDISDKLANSVGSRIKMLDEAIINNTTFESDSLNKLLESRRQQLIDEGRLVVKETQSQVEPLNTELQEKATIEQSVASPEVEGFEKTNIQNETIFVEEIAKIAGKDTKPTELSKTEDSTQVVRKLDELIGLMRRGGISVNMDGRKVSKTIATRQD